MSCLGDERRREEEIDLSMYTCGVYIYYMSQLYSMTDVIDGGLRHTHFYRSEPSDCQGYSLDLLVLLWRISTNGRAKGEEG